MERGGDDEPLDPILPGLTDRSNSLVADDDDDGHSVTSSHLVVISGDDDDLEPYMVVCRDTCTGTIVGIAALVFMVCELVIIVVAWLIAMHNYHEGLSVFVGMTILLCGSFAMAFVCNGMRIISKLLPPHTNTRAFLERARLGVDV